MVDRERFYVAHSQRLVGNITDLIWDANIAGLDNRLVTTLSSSYLDFVRPGAANFPAIPSRWSIPTRGYYGLLTMQQQTARIDNESLSFEDRLKLTRSFALVGGLRVEHIGLDRNSTDKFGLEKADFPFSQSWAPTTGRIGYTWEAVPGMTFFSQYATGADIAANNIFLLNPTDPLNLTTARTYETGVKHLFWDNRAEWSFSAYDILRKNVYAAAGGMQLNIAGRQEFEGRRARRSGAADRACCVSGATSPMSMRAMPTTISSAARSPATRRRTCRASSPMPARPIVSSRPGRSNSASPAAMSATATTPTPTP